MKKALSILLALVLLLSIVPMTAIGTAAADGGIASTAAYGVSTGDGLLAMLDRDNAPGEDVVIINVNADISYYVTTQGDSSDNSYLRYAVTVGRGRKILNLNGHSLHFYNDYSVTHDHYAVSTNLIERLSTQTLIRVPGNADLTVNGDSASGKESVLQYHGKLLNKCNAIDQREIFEVSGGRLTINSGAYYAGGEVTSYSWDDYKVYYLVGGTCIRAKTGNLTINGGYFEGRGLRDYSLHRNAALDTTMNRVYSRMSSVVINDGHFCGRSMADTVVVTGDETVNGGIFELDQNTARVGTEYGNIYFSTGTIGRQGLRINDPNPHSAYYAKANADADFVRVPIENIRDNRDYLAISKHRYLYIEPDVTNPSVIRLFCGGREHTESDNLTWSKNSSLQITVDPESLYYPADTFKKQQSLYVTLSIDQRLNASTWQTVLSDQSVTFALDSDGNYTLDLNRIGSTAKAKLVEGKKYRFSFHIIENWNSRQQYAIHHIDHYGGKFYVTINKTVAQAFCTVTEPKYGVKPSYEAQVGSDTYKIDAFTWSEKKAGSSSFSEMSANSSFTYDATYRAQFIIAVNDGYTCAANPQFYVNGKQASVTYSNELGFIGYIDFEMPSALLYSIGLFNVADPVAGETPICSCDYPAGYYTVDPLRITWYDEYGFSMKKSDTFEGGKQYTVEFLVDAEDGRRFADNVSATVNGYRATVTENWVDALNVSHARVRYTFTCPVTVTVIGMAAVDIPVPAAGELLSYEATAPSAFGYEVEDYNDNKNWKNGVKWVSEFDSNLPIGTKAEAGRTYTVWISLVLSDEESYAFADAEMFEAYIGDNPAEVYEYNEGNYALICTFTVTEAAGPDRLLGDVDGDGKVDIFDVSSIQKSLAGTSGYVKYDTLDKSSIEFRVADVDKNGQVDIYDASLIQKWMAGNAKAQTYGIGEPM